ncbi:parathyroid hormone 4-like [Acipenser oxyrinchus oxyrinchus]|uniref:Parathyroid hormone 4-like n=1 Tax=Acipenser oxyrinchus oxyrinchus TaxID=40147 RepID=A0AAD8CJV9_ACIOX|nr:parathyroid hormone 4-like [Acipenser oxyrinchus oxyrinchus]
MFLSQRSSPALIVMVIALTAFAKSQEVENKRAVTEHQFMHDKGRAMQSLKRLIWLSSAMREVHTAGRRDISSADPVWDGQESPSVRASRAETIRQLLTLLLAEEAMSDTPPALRAALNRNNKLQDSERDYLKK